MPIRNLKLVRSHLSAHFEHPITLSFTFNLMNVDKLSSVAASS